MEIEQRYSEYRITHVVTESALASVPPRHQSSERVGRVIGTSKPNEPDAAGRSDRRSEHRS
jgi:hypothetical protein